MSNTENNTAANLTRFIEHFEGLSLADRRAVAASILADMAEAPTEPPPPADPDEEALYERFAAAVRECLP
jgi:hypothetical protein